MGEGRTGRKNEMNASARGQGGWGQPTVVGGQRKVFSKKGDGRGRREVQKKKKHKNKKEQKNKTNTQNLDILPGRGLWWDKRPK